MTKASRGSFTVTHLQPPLVTSARSACWRLRLRGGSGGVRHCCAFEHDHGNSPDHGLQGRPNRGRGQPLARGQPPGWAAGLSRSTWRGSVSNTVNRRIADQLQRGPPVRRPVLRDSKGGGGSIGKGGSAADLLFAASEECQRVPSQGREPSPFPGFSSGLVSLPGFPSDLPEEPLSLDVSLNNQSGNEQRNS